MFSISGLLLLFLFLSPRVLGQPVPDAMLCLDSIREIHLHDPHRALALLDTAEQRHAPGIQPYEIDILRARCHNATGEYYLMEKYAKRALASDSVQASPQRKLAITIDLIEALNARLQYEEAIPGIESLSRGDKVPGKRKRGTGHGPSLHGIRSTDDPADGQ